MLEWQLCWQHLGSNFADLRWYCHEACYSSTYHDNSIPHAWNTWMTLCWTTWYWSSCGGSVGWQRVGEKEGKQQSDEAQSAIEHNCKTSTIASRSSTYANPTAKLSNDTYNQSPNATTTCLSNPHAAIHLPHSTISHADGHAYTPFDFLSTRRCPILSSNDANVLSTSSTPIIQYLHVVYCTIMNSMLLF